nr:S1C family serine protease [bacterium]
MEERPRTDNFWKVFSVLLLIIMIGMVGFIVWQGATSQPAFYEGKPRSGSQLASLAPSLTVADNGRFWVSDLAEESLPYVVNIQTKMKAQRRMTRAEGDGDSSDMLRQFQQVVPFNIPGMPEEMQQYQGMPEDMPMPEEASGMGSGFIVREDGYIVSNAHVVASGDEFTVRFSDGKEMPAKLIGVDEFKDIAILKVEAKG